MTCSPGHLDLSKSYIISMMDMAYIVAYLQKIEREKPHSGETNQHAPIQTLTRRVRAHSCVRETCVCWLRAAWGVTVYGIILPFAQGCRVGG